MLGYFPAFIVSFKARTRAAGLASVPEAKGRETKPRLMWCKFIEAAHLWCKTYEKASTKATEVQDGNNNELLSSSAVQRSCGMQNGRSRLINTTKNGL